MNTSQRHHYLVYTHYAQLTRGLKCFETSQGAIAYLCAQSVNTGVTFTVECLPHAECCVCNPQLQSRAG